MTGGFNVNNHVWVKVTDFGWRIYDAHWANYVQFHARPETINGWNKFQLWELMNTFGIAHTLGARPSFEGGCIYFEKPSNAS